MKVYFYLSPHTEFNPTWIKNLNIRPHALNVREEKVGNMLKFIDTGKDFLSKTSHSVVIRLEINK